MFTWPCSGPGSVKLSLLSHGDCAPAERQPVGVVSRMFLDRQIPPTDQRKEQVYRNFQANLTSIVQAGIAAGVPVILSSVASNLKDCPPFGSLPPQGLAGADSARWNALFRDGVTNQTREEFAAALDIYQQAARDSFAKPGTPVRLGRVFLKADNIEEARRHFVLARDLDALPFRADSRINGIIAETADHYTKQHVFFLDAEQALAAGSRKVHPGRGVFLRARAFEFCGELHIGASRGRTSRALPPVRARRRPAV